MRASRRRTRSAGARIPVALVFLAAGCGNLTSGGVGDVDVFLSPDDEEGRASVPAMAPYGLGGAALDGAPGSAQVAPLAPRPSSREPLVGTLTVQVQLLLLVGPDEEVVPVTDGFEDVVLDLRSPEPVLVGSRPVPARRYSGVRTVFGKVVADVDRLVTAEGDTVSGEIPVQLGAGGRIVVDDPLLEVEVRDRSRSTVFIDLNSSFWLRLVDAAQRQVQESDFRNAVRIRAQ